MIKIIEDIKDYAVGKYWDFITDREFNGKDPNYFGEVSDKITEELYNFFSDLIAEEDSLTESWTSESNLKAHFERHCVGNDKKSSRKNVRYDFITVDEYRDYEDKINEKVLHPNYKIVSLLNTPRVFSALTELVVQPTSILFDTPCGFKNSNDVVQIGLNSFANGVTTNYGTDTINLMVLSNTNNTISMYAIDSALIRNKFKSIVNKYISDKNIRNLYK